MKIRRLLTVMAPLTVGLALSLPAFGQEATGPSASDSMKQAGRDTESAADNAYQGVKTAFKDTSITAKVKTALHNDSTTRRFDIDVHTTAGVVTLTGNVPSSGVAARAEELAQNTEGVAGVRNDLKRMTTPPQSAE